MKNFLNKKYSVEKMLALFAVLLALIAAAIGDPQPARDIPLMESVAGKKIDYIEARQLAINIMSRKSTFIIIDLRGQEKYQRYHIPSALDVSKQDLQKRALFSLSDSLILYGEDQKQMAEKWLSLKEAGYKKVLLLKGGIQAWADEVLFPDLTDQPNINREAKAVTKMSLFFGGKPKLNTAGRSPLSRRYMREGC